MNTNEWFSKSLKRLNMVKAHMTAGSLSALTLPEYPKLTLEDLIGKELDQELLNVDKKHWDIIKKSRGRYMLFQDLKYGSTWSLDKEKSGGQLMSTMDNKSGLKVMYRKIIFNVPMEKAIAFIKDSDMMFEINDTIKEWRRVEECGLETCYYYYVLKGNMLVSDRDLSLVTHCFSLPDGRFMSMSFSTVHPKLSTVKGRVRANINISAYLITPIDKTR